MSSLYGPGLIMTPMWENGVFRGINAVEKMSGWNCLAYNEYENMLLSSVMVKNMNGQNEMMMTPNRNTIPVF